MNNRVVHFEITSNDPEKSTRFYKEVFGWKIEKWDGPQPYWLIMTGQDGYPGIDGGILKRSDPSDRVVNCIEVESVDAFCKKIQSSGGTVTVPKMEVPGVGFMAYCQDPDQNDFSIMQFSEASKKRTLERIASRNVINWFEVPVKDISRAAKFYSTVLGAKLEVSEMGPSKMAVFPIESVGVHGALVQGPGYTPTEQGALLYFRADPDLTPMLAKVAGAGGKVLKEKHSIGPHGFVAHCLDSEGNRFALHSHG